MERTQALNEEEIEQIENAANADQGCPIGKIFEGTLTLGENGEIVEFAIEYGVRGMGEVDEQTFRPGSKFFKIAVARLTATRP